MSRFTSQTAQTSFSYVPVAAADRLWLFLRGMVRLEPATSAVYAENAKIRMSGRTWLM